jgi:hypothetical protein
LLRSDGIRAEDEQLLTSIVQFDVLADLAAIDGAHSTDTKVFYTNFARFRQDRIQPAVERLLTDEGMRAEIFRGTDQELAIALSAIEYMASREGAMYAGYHSFRGTVVERWVQAHLPPETSPN